MSIDERDTHFLGFAETVQKELANHLAEYDPNECIFLAITRDTLARRAYDLVLHVLGHTTPASGSTILKYQDKTIAEIAAMIPDLPKLPEAEK